MSARNRQMHFGLLMTANGSHFGGWRLPQADPAASFRLQHYVEMTREAERGCFDLVFMADTLALVPTQLPATLGHAPPIAHLEPLTLLSALSAVTTHIGLAGSATTTYNHPYQVARLFASLDHLSGGRAGWNLITSGNPAEAWNFGFERHPDHADRYDRAREFAEVVFGLWDSWTDDAFVFDKVRGQYFEPARMRAPNHQGKHFRVKGPLNMARPPQGRPVVAQAGSSEAGRALAAATADIVFTAQQNLKGARDFYADMKARTAACGRDPASIAVLPGVAPIIGDTDAEARRRYQALQDAFDPLIGLDALSAEFGIDLSAYPLDAPLPEDLPTSPRATSRRDLMLEQMRREQLTLRQLGAQTASLGHWVLCGTAPRIADTLEEWFQGGAADGFIMMPSALPSGLGEFVRHVVPELQRRGLFRKRYEGRTLREHLGLARPDL
jgi:FMN-dependent oxidoreductase (nitrilotriacetate monooxygenase family)